jgi:hypothetical protein
MRSIKQPPKPRSKESSSSEPYITRLIYECILYSIFSYVFFALVELGFWYFIALASIFCLFHQDLANKKVDGQIN